MKEKVFVLAANRYNFVDQTTGEVRKGTTVYYVNGLAVSNYMDAKDLILELLNTQSKVTVRVPAGTTEEQAKEVFQALVQSGATIKKGNFAFGLLHVE